MLCGREGSELTLSLKCYRFLCCSHVSGSAQAAAPSCVFCLLVPVVTAADSPFMHIYCSSSHQAGPNASRLISSAGALSACSEDQLGGFGPLHGCGARHMESSQLCGALH